MIKLTINCDKCQYSFDFTSLTSEHMKLTLAELVNIGMFYRMPGNKLICAECAHQIMSGDENG